MKFAVVLENAPDCELDRWEFEAVSADDEDAIDRKVSEILDGVCFRVGDTIRIVQVSA